MKKEFEEEYVEVNGIAHFLLHYPKAPLKETVTLFFGLQA